MNSVRMIRCPICGGPGRTETAWHSDRVDGKYGVIAVCKSCGAKTPICTNIADAVAEWNDGNVSRCGEYMCLSLFNTFQ